MNHSLKTLTAAAIIAASLFPVTVTADPAIDNYCFSTTTKLSYRIHLQRNSGYPY
ncbi:MAG: hypothetical protein P8P30_04425 [Rickettsiales bacterium]|nr:hypothetical protein [Rickettsiales bacterium]